MFNLRRDPFERADENSNTYWDWVLSHVYIVYAMQALVANQIAEFEKFPPRQKPASFNLDAVMRTAGGGAQQRRALSPSAPTPLPQAERGSAFSRLRSRSSIRRGRR